MRIHHGPVDSPHKGSITRKVCPYHDVALPLTCMCSTDRLLSGLTMCLWSSPNTEARDQWHLPYNLQGRDMSCRYQMVSDGSHDDVIKWKHFSRYWPFVRGIHRSSQSPLTRSFDVCFDQTISIHNDSIAKLFQFWFAKNINCVNFILIKFTSNVYYGVSLTWNPKFD